MRLTKDRLRHSIGVARMMQSIVQKVPHHFQCSPEESFYLGLLHDTAYEFVEDVTTHEHVGGELLHNLGYKYWREVFYHGDPDADYNSNELWLLNYADMVVGPHGESMTITERVNDIMRRYGNDSIQYSKACRLAQMIEEKFALFTDEK